jgi:hypothetical protein
MNFLKNPEIENHPLVQCIKQTDILCNKNKNILYKELQISPLYHLKNIFKKDVNLPTEDKEIKKIFEIILSHNENSVNKLMQEYTTIKNSTSFSL